MRTYHNTLNDWLTREDESKVKADMKAQGWTQLSLTGDWEEMLRGAVRPTLRLPREKGETAALAAQLSETIGQVLASPATLKYSLSQEGLCQIKFGDHLACFELGWARGGGSTTRVKEANWLTASISFDPLGTEASSVKRAFAEARQLKGAIIDAPQSLSQKSKQILTELGWRHGPLHNAIVQTDHLGSFFARKRSIWLYGAAANRAEQVRCWKVAEVNPCCMLPQVGGVPLQLAAAPSLHVHPRAHDRYHWRSLGFQGRLATWWTKKRTQGT